MDREVADDWSLLRAIQAIEEDKLVVGSSLEVHLVTKPAFQIIREDEHLRSLLRALLELNIAVRAKRREAPRRSSLALLFRKQKLKEYQEALDLLVSQRDEAYKKFEMLRRLTAWDNTLLVRHKA